MNEIEADTDTEQRRTVARCMHHVPDNMNIKEGYYLMNMMYTFGTLSDYLADLDTFAANMRNGLIPNGDALEFKNSFDFDDEYNIKLDPKTGRTTSLLFWKEDWNYDDACSPIIVPSIIKHLQCLESIELWNCQSLIMEFGNLPLKTIDFYACPSKMFEDIPEGLHFPSIKKLFIDGRSKFSSNLSLLLKIFSNNLKELHFEELETREQIDAIFRVLRNDNDLCFTKSLTTIRIKDSILDEKDLEILMFEIRERFPNLRTLDISGNKIKSLCGIHDRIKKIRSSSSSSSSSSSRSVLSGNNLLRELNLKDNYLVLDDVIKNSIPRTKKDHKEKSALLTILDTFYGISNLGYGSTYDPDVEYALRINHAGRKIIRDKEISSGTTTATATAPVINKALWPIILDRAYKKSGEIYNLTWINKEDREKTKCATGLFDLVCHYCARWDDDNNNNNNSNENDSRQTNTTATLNCKRKRK